jgi:hypothetical protein
LDRVERQQLSDGRPQKLEPIAAKYSPALPVAAGCHRIPPKRKAKGSKPLAVRGQGPRGRYRLFRPVSAPGSSPVKRLAIFCQNLSILPPPVEFSTIRNRPQFAERKRLEPLNPG